MLKVGLLGAGRIGQVHAKAIHSHLGSELLAVSDVFSDNAEKVANLYGAKVKSSKEILADPTVDAVLIATSTDTHTQYIEAATKAGKPVLCEKPVDLDLQRARECLQTVNATDVPVMIGFNRRFDPSFRALKSSLEAGEVGKAEILSVTSFDPSPPPIDYVRVSGGMFRDMSVHDFDMVNFIMSKHPETIYASGSSLVDADIGAAGDIDTAILTLTYASGEIAVIKNSRRAVYGYDQRIELLCSDGMLQAQNVAENTLVKSTTNGVSAAKPTYFFLERYMPAYEAEWAAFVNAITQGSAMPVTLEDGVASLAMAEAAMKSLQTGQAVKLAEYF